MKNSIYFNTKKRTNAVNSLEKDFFNFTTRSSRKISLSRKSTKYHYQVLMIKDRS